MRLPSQITVLIASAALAFQVNAAESFIVKNIRFEGLKQINPKTAMNYVPIHVGDNLTNASSQDVVKSLYHSGLFQDIKLNRQGNTLIINVIERGVITKVEISGNHQVKTDDINKLVKSAGQNVGQMYSHASAESIRQVLLAEYAQLGYARPAVKVYAAPTGKDGAALKIDINEGAYSKIKEIDFIGNHAFSSFRLKNQLKITTPRLWTFITKTDRFSQEKLDASTQALTEFYLNHGYYHFKMNSAQALPLENGKGLKVVFDMSEGSQYHFGHFGFSGRTILSENALQKLVTFRPGDVYSREHLQKTVEALGTALGDQGYGFAQVEPIPQVDEQSHVINFNFFISPGKRVYIRRIAFSGNTITADYVLRHAVQQMEGSMISVSKIKESIRKLNLLGYFKDVQVKSTPVPGTNNQVDLDYDVKEINAGMASVNFGYSTLTKFGVGAGINQPNFMGTGRTVGINFSRNNYVSSYGANYYNPYFTRSGIGFGMNLTYEKTKPTALNISDYRLDTYGADFYYTIPVSLNDTLQLGYGLKKIHIGTTNDPNGGAISPTEVLDFVNRYGSDFEQVVLDASINHNGQDKVIFPTQGLLTSLAGQVSVPAFSRKLEYYKVGLTANYLLPLERTHEWIFSVTGGTTYGNGYGDQKGLPFFANYYAGGLSQGQVLGYDSASLGPLDSNHQAIGGNFLTYGSLELIFPNYISDTLRTSLFIDGANVYQTDSYLEQFDTDGSGPIRFSGGLAVTWRSPMGLISISVAHPINKQTRDEQQVFQFTMGTSL